MTGSIPIRSSLLKMLIPVLILVIGCCNTAAQQPQSHDPLLPIGDPNRPPGASGYSPVRGVKHSNPTTVSVGSVLDSNEAKETFLKVDNAVVVICSLKSHFPK